MTGLLKGVLTPMVVSLILGPISAQAFDPFKQAGIDQHPNAKIPLSSSFVDETGRDVRLDSLARGRPMLLVPLLHRCPNICGVTLSGLMDAIRSQSYQPGEDFAVVAMSIDPAETPSDAQQSMVELRKRYPNLALKVHALTGSRKAIAAVTQALGYRYAWDPEIGQYAHVAATAVVTPAGHLSHWLYGLAPTPDDLKLALTEAGQGQIGSWANQLLLLCYHYDPTTGQYSPIIWDALRIFAGVTAALLLGWLGLSVMRERRKEVERDG
ncbi:SCO family protein [Rhizobium leguminosarum]|uniref:SCO family protein n=1 Tax=Rhizobium leguminosarum TaxID=384 RepID=UPI001C97232F|nr:SCO family protein [Rhizobium leguminosarum]MBY5371104.1 SCO family protein [Rhizobium leguminosarum]